MCIAISHCLTSDVKTVTIRITTVNLCTITYVSYTTTHLIYNTNWLIDVIRELCEVDSHTLHPHDVLFVRTK